MKSTSFIFALAILLTSLCVAQEKPVPGQRAVTVAPPDSMAQSARQEPAASNQALPKFEIPEYVITGIVSIDLPDASKQGADELPQKPDLADPSASLRDRSTYDFTVEQKSTQVSESRLAGTGRLQASSGTYLTSHLGLRHTIVDPTSFISIGADYRVANAFIPHANRSGGEASVGGGFHLRDPGIWYDGGLLGGGIGFGSETYRLYGSQNPTVARTLTTLKIDARYESPRQLLVLYDAALGLQLRTIKDSTASLTETLFNARTGLNFFVGKIPLDLGVDFTLGSVTGTTTKALPYLDGRISTERLWFGDFYLQASVHGYLAQGMLNQKLARVYPHVVLGYQILRNTQLSVSYAGRVQQNTLAGLVARHPYIGAHATLRQSDIPIDVTALLETDWSPVWRTRLSIRYQSIRDLPLFTGSGVRGIWMTDYRGTTRIGTYRGDLFAKFTANSYFTVSAEINDNKNTATEWKVPYLPDVRLTGGAQLEVIPDLTVCPTLQYVGMRVPDLFVAGKLSGYFSANLHAEYSVIRAFSVALDVLNLTNARYEEWSGYRSVPLTVTGGLTLRW
jgi:hypothetical protein